MKDIFKSMYKSKILKTIITLLSTVIIVQFIVFPGLTMANTLVNIGSALIGLFLLLFLLFFFKIEYLNDALEGKHPLYEPDENKEPETELDYVSPPKKKKKSNSKPKKKPTNPIK